MLPALVAAQSSSSQTGSQDPQPTTPVPPTTAVTVTVVGTTPLVGIELPVSQVAAPVQTLTARSIETSGALDLAAYLNQRLNGVHVNETQGNPFQTDVNYRGYTASPLLGTPQGLSVYMDGVRLNQPFGDVVSWDLIPQVAIFSGALMPGSNPLFGLNTLGGALSIQTKDGRNSPGTKVQAIYGSDVRRSVEFEHGGSHAANGLNWYVAGNLFAEDGWRDDSPSDVRQLFGKLGMGTEPQRRRGRHSPTRTTRSTAMDFRRSASSTATYRSVYTKPDETNNRSTFLNVTANRALSDRMTFSGQRVLSRHQHRHAQRRHQRRVAGPGPVSADAGRACGAWPRPATPTSLRAAPTPSNTPFPYLRCVGNVLLNDEPAEKCNGLINRGESRSAQRRPLRATHVA